MSGSRDKRGVRPDGYYWVRFGNASEPEIAFFADDGTWDTIGSDDYYVGDDGIQVLAGPLEPPK